MAEIQYTHRWDGCFKGLVLLGGMSVAIVPAAFADGLLAQILGYDSSLKTVLAAIVWALVGFGLIFLTAWYFGNLPNYLYFRLSLGIPLSYEDSKTYAFLLVPDEEGRWMSLTKIKSVPKQQRKEFLRAVARAVLEERKNKRT